LKTSLATQRSASQHKSESGSLIRCLPEPPTQSHTAIVVKTRSLNATQNALCKAFSETRDICHTDATNGGPCCLLSVWRNLADSNSKDVTMQTAIRIKGQKISDSSEESMATSKQKRAARKNIKKAAAAAKKHRTIAHLPKSTRTALGKKGASAARKKRAARR
jgi:hypothetical protein